MNESQRVSAPYKAADGYYYLWVPSYKNNPSKLILHRWDGQTWKELTAQLFLPSKEWGSWSDDI